MRENAGEIVDYVAVMLKRKGSTFAEMCEAEGLKGALFSMWRSHPNMSPQLKTLLAISRHLGVTLDEIVGMESLEAEPLPDDIAEMVRMLLRIPKDIREGIGANIEFYYNKEAEKKSVKNSSAG